MLVRLRHDEVCELGKKRSERMHLPPSPPPAPAAAARARRNALPAASSVSTLMDITVSGSGNGADMAVQLHVAFSRTISGACLHDAQPFHCATTRFPGEPLVDASRTAPQLCDRHCESGRTLRFDHCRADPTSIDVGMLPDYPRRACRGDSGPADGGGRVDACLDDPRFLGESRVYLAPGADADVTANAAGRTGPLPSPSALTLCPHPLPSPSVHCPLPPPTALCPHPLLARQLSTR